VMSFVGSDEADRWILPWFFKAVEHRGVAAVEQSRSFYIGDRVTIRNGHDIGELETDLTRDPSRRPILTLRPEVQLLRDKQFVLEVASLATKHNLPVELEGSSLSHAYYLLDQAGAAVRVVDPFVRKERRRTFGKLVRDLVPVKIRRHGELADVYRPDRTELIPLVKAKLVEEALEHYWTDDTKHAVEELADVLEILRAAARAHGTDFEAVEAAAAKKRRERGGFESGVVLVETRPALDGVQRGPRRRLITEDTEAPRLSLRQRRPVRLPARRVVLPLVPPDGWDRGRAYIQPVDAADELVITYGSDDVLLEVRPRRQDPDRRQMVLEFPRDSPQSSRTDSDTP
jgi:predicted house-cleaning noncanonical NTP pyrophosphatase (MazG superfamily)